jgi:hypothetical protein
LRADGESDFNAALSLFPAEKLEAASNAASYLLGLLDVELASVKPVGHNYRPSKYVDPFCMSIAFDKLGVLPNLISSQVDSVPSISDGTTDRSRVLVVDERVYSDLNQDDNLSLALMCLGGQTTTLIGGLDRPHLFPERELKQVFGRHYQAILRPEEPSELGVNNFTSDGFDIGFIGNAGGIDTLYPDVANQHRFWSQSNALVGYEKIVDELRSGGTFILSQSVSSGRLADEFQNIGLDQTDDVLDRWRNKGVTVHMYPRYCLSFNTFEPTENHVMENPVITIERDNAHD